MKRFAIIGFGGLGKSHFINLMRLEWERGDIQLVAICNSDIESISKNVTINIGTVNIENVDFSRFNLYTDYKEMLKKENLDFVFIALPTYLHAEVAIYCMENGVDVYTEKPMAVTLEECEAMIDTSKKFNRKLMVGQCLRFTPNYIFLKNLVTRNTYGKLIKAEMYRKSPLPNWSFGNWLLHDETSGGCLVDMHVHDVDAMVWLLGTPDEFHIESTHHYAEYESAFCTYKYPDTIVSIVADWGLPATFKFSSGYKATFERGYVESTSEGTYVYTENKREEVILGDDNSLYDEVVEFVAHVVDNKPLKTATLESVHETMKLLFAEKERAKNNK